MVRTSTSDSTTPLLGPESQASSSSSPSRHQAYTFHIPRSPSRLRPPLEPELSYQSIPSRSHSYSRAPRLRKRRLRTPVAAFFPAVITVVLLALASFAAWDVSSLGKCWLAPLCRVLGDGERLAEVWRRNTGAYAPWTSVGEGGGKRGNTKRLRD